MLITVQELVCFEVLEEAIQAAALEADFTFPDDSASSNGDQSLIIDDIIESLESDALEAEQEALEVRRAEEEAQVGICSCNMHLLPENWPVPSGFLSSNSHCYCRYRQCIILGTMTFVSTLVLHCHHSCGHCFSRPDPYPHYHRYCHYHYHCSHCEVSATSPSTRFCAL